MSVYGVSNVNSQGAVFPEANASPPSLARAPTLGLTRTDLVAAPWVVTVAMEGDVGQGQRRLCEVLGGEGAVTMMISASDCREGDGLCSGLFYELAMQLDQPKPGVLLPVCRGALCVSFVLRPKSRGCEPTIFLCGCVSTSLPRRQSPPLVLLATQLT